MGLGIKTRLKRMAGGPFVNDEYVEARALGALLRAPAGIALDAPAEGAALHIAFVVPFFRQGSGGRTTTAHRLWARGRGRALWSRLIRRTGVRSGGGAGGAGRGPGGGVAACVGAEA